MSTAVVVPWRGGCPHREAAWSWVRRQYERHHPDWEIVEATGPPGPWVKALAVNPAVERTDADVVIVADADAWTTGLEQCTDVVRTGVAGWAVPHSIVRRLTREATALVLAGAADLHDPALPLCERPYRGVLGGGFVVARRETLIDVPLDQRFEGWGQEDLSLAVALHVLHGPAWRGATDLHHLWHPPPERVTRKVGNPAGQLLHRRYIKARRDPAAMRALIREAQPCPSQH